ncbi:MAG: UbiA prenyltransferase family protein [Synergistaceae bacterium]|jgi:4-hydroxybenzoate polyprenyltransferase|nr:UbiA prenyltransferase family protein [Synergistaceae bacterium]
MPVIAYIKQLRPKSWLKNVFVFMPLVFSLELTNLPKLAMCGLAFVAFCLTSSTVYTFNDLLDAEQDAEHPIKCRRPIASGAIPKSGAAVFCALLLISGLTLALFVNLPTAVIAAAYLAINVAYTIRLKHLAIIDCFCIAAGFVLRVYAGSAAIGDKVSNWLFLTVIAMSLFMAFGKRRGEMMKMEGSLTRHALEQYDLRFLNGMMFVCAGLMVVFYSLWAMARGLNMIYTVPVVIFIVCKYLLLVHDDDSHGDPTTVIFEDKTLLAASGLYALLTVGLLYAGRFM